jgi:uncharacterized repeat protein (TIGR01451 family)
MTYFRWFIFFALTGFAFAAPAGTVIYNQAIALVGGQTYFSNELETVVQSVCVPVFSPQGSPALPGQRALSLAGTAVYFAYVLYNQGNDRFSFNLSWVQDSAPWSPATVKFYSDLNANGRLEPGEPQVSSVLLDPDARTNLIFEVRTPTTALGDLNISPTATCPDNTRASDAYSRITIGSGSAVNISKSVSAVQVSEGQTVTFTVRANNLGNLDATGPITLTDFLNTPELGVLGYVPGSAVAPKGRLEYNDGSSWSTTPTTVQGIRLVLDKLEAGADAFFSFQMLVLPGVGTQRNVATLASPEGSGTTSVELQITPRYGVFLGPIGNPTASGSADRQTASVVAGQLYCFKQSLLNAGNSADTFSFSTQGLPSGVSVLYRTLAGTNLALPIPLNATTQLDFEVCLAGISSTTAPFIFSLGATSSSGLSDSTIDEVSQVINPNQVVLRKRSDVSVVDLGGRIIYSLEIQNPLPIALNNATISDTLDPGLVFVSASNGGTYLAPSVVWNLNIAANTTQTLTLEVRLREGFAGASINNQFSLQADQVPTLLSNIAVVGIRPGTLLLQKQVQPTQATYGDLLTYTLTVSNPSQTALNVRLEDTPAAGLAYVPGSSVPVATQLSTKLVWELTLAPNTTRSITYKMRVVVGAAESLANTVTAAGTSGSSVSVNAVASATVSLKPGVFTPANTVAGRVFLDKDRDGKYTAGLDMPLPGARLVLSNGLQAATDSAGRYTFRSIGAGSWILSLDPSSAPFKPLPHPEALEGGYRHRIWVAGLVYSDFPLESPQGSSQITRETTLEFGPVRVTKQLLVLPTGVRVVLVLSSRETLTGLTLIDPLPTGGERRFEFERFEGSQTLTYDLPAGSPLTDPQVRWRYP